MKAIVIAVMCLILVTIVSGCGCEVGKTHTVSENGHIKLKVIDNSVHAVVDSGKIVAAVIVENVLDGKLELRHVRADGYVVAVTLPKKHSKTILPVVSGDKLGTNDGATKAWLSIPSSIK